MNWSILAISPVGRPSPAPRVSQNLEMRKVLRGHDERVTGVSWHPDAYSTGKPLLASGAADK